MAELTPYDQLLLELVNRARMNPIGEAARYGISVNEDLPAGTINSSVRQPLAPNALLSDAALGHSNWMLVNDTFSHFGAGHSLPGDRMRESGFVFSGTWNWGENVAWRGTSGVLNLQTFTYQLHRDLFLSPSHRFSILNGEFRELGVGMASGRFTQSSGTYDSVLVTENFALSGPDVFVTGVAINDRDGDRFYDIGEGAGGITVTINNGGSVEASDRTASAGGYAIAFAGGPADVTFSGAGLPAPVTVSIDAGNQNAKVDLVNTTTILSSANAELGEGAVNLFLLGAADLSAIGNDLANKIAGNAGMNVLRGMGGNDILVGGYDGDILTGGAGQDTFDFNSRFDSGRALGTFDTVTDFTSGTDVIDLSTIDARMPMRGNQGFCWIGTNDFHGRAGELRYQGDGSNVIVSGDLNGDGKADFSIHLDHVSHLNRGDFVL